MSPAADKAPLQVWKFGGRALADAAAIRKAAALIVAHKGPLAVVCSALAGVTDQLLQGAVHAVEGRDREAASTAAALLVRHRRIVRELVPAGRKRRALLSQ